ncbi:serine--tRNA ligase [bacterium]|nr:serine--tRNA ligase [bacterium]
MLDIKFIRENPDAVRHACQTKGFPDVTDAILTLDARVRELKTITQTKTAEKNKISREIATATDKAQLIAQSKQIGDEIAADAAELADKESQLTDLMHRVPQIPDADAPVGPDEDANVEIRRVGTPRDFDFTPRAHWDLLDMNGWWMPEKIAQLSGARVYALMGAAAELDLAIQTYVIQKLIARGFCFVQCPSITKPQTIFNAGHFMGADMSIMNDDVFMLTDTDRCLAGTSEIVLNSLHSGTVLDEKDLPLKYAGWSACFRKEAGAAGRDTRGLMRVHQFNKVEQYVYCTPDQMNDMHEQLLQNLCDIMADLEFPYRVLANSTGDMGFNKVKMNDVEAWVPSEGKYRELGSCSSIGQFQARRTNTRYRAADGSLQYCATLNNTGIALPRALIPVLENHQNPDGSINIPRALQPLMGGRTKIGGKH